MQRSTEKYKLCLMCKCLACKKETITKEPYSCLAYPNRREILADVWNKPEVLCEYFEPKYPSEE